jgi:hypothetical protein
MTAAGIRAALAASAAGMIAKSVNEHKAAAQQLDQADYTLLALSGVPLSWRNRNPHSASLFCRSGLA